MLKEQSLYNATKSLGRPWFQANPDGKVQWGGGAISFHTRRSAVACLCTQTTKMRRQRHVLRDQSIHAIALGCSLDCPVGFWKAGPVCLGYVFHFACEQLAQRRVRGAVSRRPIHTSATTVLECACRLLLGCCDPAPVAASKSLRMSMCSFRSIRPVCMNPTVVG